MLNLTKLKGLMQQHDVSTQRKLAKSSGISETMISNYFTGNRNPTLNSMIKIAQVFGVSVKEISIESELEDLMTQHLVRLSDALDDLSNAATDDVEACAKRYDSIVAAIEKLFPSDQRKGYREFFASEEIY